MGVLLSRSSQGSGHRTTDPDARVWRCPDNVQCESQGVGARGCTAEFPQTPWEDLESRSTKGIPRFYKGSIGLHGV